MTELRDQLQGTLGAAYTLERELGGGGMSRVFVATEKALGRSVVVKVLPPDLAGGVNIDRFRREVRFAARLQHPHIVPLLTAGEMDGVPYYTMPFVEGQSLRARLSGAGALPLTEALGILRDVAKALAYAHAQGVVHRDIKPDNVLLSGGVAVVMDFGIAKALSSSTSATGRTSITMTGTSIGTPAYMAPEQAAADPATDHRADIYSFGCMAYELLTGQPPFFDVAPHKRLVAQISETPAPIAGFRPDVPAALEELVMRCLEKDPANRPQHAGEVTATLDSVVARHSAQLAVPSSVLVPVVLGKALMLYVASVIAVLLLARAATLWIGLPEWVVAGALIVMGLGLPVVLLTAWVHYVTRRAASEPPAAPPRDGRVPRRSLAVLAERARPHVSWSRNARGGLLALGAFVLVVSGFMTMRALGIGPPGSLLAAGRLSERDRLLVGDFRISGGDSSLARVVAEAVRTGLGESPLFSTMSPAAISAALRRMQRAPTAWVDVDLAREIALREGAKAVVTGDVNPLGQGYVVTVRLVSADSGAELASFHETADTPRELLPTVDKLTRQLRGKAGESLRDVHADPPLEQVTTSSLDALRLYVEGSRANAAGADDSAIRALTAAIAVDTSFAMAYRKLAASYNNAQYPRTMRDSALKKAYQYRDRLTERERGTLLGDYFTRGPGMDRGKGIAAYEALLARYPYDAVAMNNLGNALETRREFARAESLFARLAAAEPRVPIYPQNLLGILVVEGKFAEARRVAEQLQRRFPNQGTYTTQLAALYYARGDADSALALVGRLRQSRAPAERAIALQLAAGTTMSRGRLQEAMALRAERSAVNSARGAPAPALEDSLLESFLDIWFRERPDRGLQRMEAALARTPLRSLATGDEPYYTMSPGYAASTPYFTVATQYALAGKPDRARAVLAQYDADVRDSLLRRLLEPARQNALGEIALAEGRALEAVAAFRRGDQRNDGPATSCTGCPVILLARAYDRAGMTDSAIVMFERYLATSGPFRMVVNNDGIYLAGTHKRLGELYEAKGDRRRAADHYRKFVALWRNADAELQPKVAEVQQRLARIGRPDG
ncbi:MAG TPA: protein kinase [Gemmatimonadaceae bacterium]|nr:protein kinase [Gemmatimonadaceae bacterium]